MSTAPIALPQLLNPLVVNNPYAEKSNNESLSLMWKIYSYALRVLAATSIVLSIICLNPLYLLPLVIIFVTPPKYGTPMDQAVYYAKLANFDGQIVGMINRMRDVEVSSRLRDLGINEQPGINLKPLLARYCLYQNLKMTQPKQAAYYNLQSAYLLKIMQSPSELRSLEDFHNPFPPEDFALKDTLELAYEVFEFSPKPGSALWFKIHGDEFSGIGIG
jgi:hypothetical protein